MRKDGTHIPSMEESEAIANKVTLFLRNLKGVLYTWWNKKKFGQVGTGFSAPCPIHVVNGKNIKIGHNVFLGMNCQLYAYPQGTITLDDHVSIDRFVEIRGGKRIEIGKKVRIVKGSTLKAPDDSNIIIGARTIISQDCLLDGDIHVGQDVIFGPHVFVNEVDHGFETREVPMNQQEGGRGTITIEDDVWIGYGVVILKGVHVEKGAILGANAVVNKSVTGYSINAGVPCRFIRERAE
ncbi:acyltransferase [Paenibacillus alginolyticus]|uniref:Acyltransferase n=1 Tax=Paenibacillus alginolyticus TaxID=59839 RepID=A0ABT4G893_9BACL|nr:acyltransferase [Paenibacillus alginolyticus]MCY9692364.1 acyltransferase [Paenibacillus alginolyticus]MEC0143663.1 acyltransferase [Paenibacillus alginolyticus]